MAVSSEVSEAVEYADDVDESGSLSDNDNLLKSKDMVICASKYMWC